VKKHKNKQVLHRPENKPEKIQKNFKKGNNSLLEKRVRYLDGLRGLSCLWVMWYHLGVMLHLSSTLNLGLFYRGMVPVYLFFILSGFVIAGLIREKQENYRDFIVRRFFRIWPAFAFLSVVGLFLLGFMLGVLDNLGNRQPIRQHIDIYQSSQQYWWQHLLIHFSMLHGFFDETIPWSSKSFIPPGWTITVEWQFYLLAPLLVASFRYGLVVLVWLGSTWLQWRYGNRWDGVYLFEYMDYFLMGIASYLAVQRFQQRIYLLPGLAVLGAIVLAFRGSVFHEPVFNGHVALFLWLLFMLFVYFPNQQVACLAEKIFSNRMLVFYGEISYSLYLLHMFVVFAVLWLTLPWQNSMEPITFFLLNLVLLTLLATGLATFLYRSVELPCMRWASRIVRSWH
jgi:peptidoglycan/LPS O-acetylase OafA/YrhL